MTQQVGKAMAEKDWAKTLKLRGSSFNRNFEIYKMLAKVICFRSNTCVNTIAAQLRPPTDTEKKELRVGIVHVGAPCCGMNAAVRSAVRKVTARGITAFAIHEVRIKFNFVTFLASHSSMKGIDGLMEGDICELGWNGVNGWVSQGGANLGTRHTLCTNMGKIVEQLKVHKINALIGIGGFEVLRYMQ